VRGPRPARSPTPGFSLLEALVAMAIIAVLAGFGVPALLQMLVRSKLQGSAREIAVQLGSSRVSAMRLGRPVVVQPRFDSLTMVSFVDDDEDLIWDAGEKELSTLSLPGAGGNRGIFLMGPDRIVGTPEDPAQAIEGLTVLEAATPGDPEPRMAVFQPDGSIRAPGGIRIGDGKNPANVFEVRIEPAATARVEILKFVYNDPRGITHDGEPAGSWFGPGGNMWEWY
jgi:prepilin-type N-terminal cleavage/methylation domain-containing protein